MGWVRVMGEWCCGYLHVQVEWGLINQTHLCAWLKPESVTADGDRLKKVKTCMVLSEMKRQTGQRQKWTECRLFLPSDWMLMWIKYWYFLWFHQRAADCHWCLQRLCFLYFSTITLIKDFATEISYSLERVSVMVTQPFDPTSSQIFFHGRVKLGQENVRFQLSLSEWLHVDQLRPVTVMCCHEVQITKNRNWIGLILLELKEILCPVNDNDNMELYKTIHILWGCLSWI